MKAIEKNKVNVLPSIFRERMQVNRAYLLELDSMCLLQNFYLEAGIVMPGLQVLDDPTTANLHWGWEAPTCQLRGHFLGHWLAAAAGFVASENDQELKVKLDYIIAELAKCQELNGGEWVGSLPEKYFEKLANSQNVWSPQYTMHKTIMGLMSAYVDAGNQQALDILDGLSRWYIRWTEEMSVRAPYAIYKGEEAGMLEIWARLYEITGDEKYLTLAKCYWGTGLFDNLLEGKDPLTNSHANASIPFSHGAAKLYEITGEEKWRKITELFWKSAVTDRGMYSTSGQNAGEFWIPPHMSGQFIGDRNQEFCTVYNMVRTAQYLYKWTGDTQYADYIERCLYNGFLAQQNAETGMPTYFLPLKAGSRKKWGSKTHDFWCCHGTMVQAQALYPELIYFTDNESDKLVISQYIPSKLSFNHNENIVDIEQNVDMKYYNDQAFFDENDDSQMSRWSLKFSINSPIADEFTLSLRIPSWVNGAPLVQINGENITVTVENGYINIKKVWEKDVITMFLPSVLCMEALPDMPELVAIVDGPIVLAGLTDSDNGLVGDFDNLKSFIAPQIEHTYGTYPWQQNHYITRNQPKNIRILPLYEISEEAYTVYFTKRVE